MKKPLPLLILCLLLTACTSTPKPSPIIQPPAPYALDKPGELPRALRIALTNQRGYLFAHGAVDGHRAGMMLLDTGSSLNIVDRGLVNRLKLEQVGQGRTVGIAGTETFSQHRLDSLAIGNLDLGVDQAASLSLLKLTRGLGVSPGGLIGSVSLLPHPFTIDYAKQELVVYNRQTFVPPADAERVGLEFYGRLPAVRAKLANGREVLLIIDTGADNAVALPMELASWPGIVATSVSGAGSSRGVGGSIQTQSGFLKDLHIFGFNLGGVPVTFEPKTREPRRNDLPVGRVGGQLLKGFRLTFDARYRSLWIEFAAATEGQ